MTATVSSPGAVRAGRWVELDRLRGLAIACMVADHLALFAGWGLLRETVGRVALPLFFVLAGHLLQRLSWRHLGIGLLGLLLPVAAPWVDAPNVLLAYAVLAPLLVWAPGPRWAAAFLVLALTGLANGWGAVPAGTNAYPLLALLALMCAGRLVPRFELARLGAPLPRFLEVVGRYPVTLYAAHVLALTYLWPVG